MIWINGTFQDSPLALSVYDKINLGLSVFTTMLVVKADHGIQMMHGADHYARLVRHVGVLDLTVPYTEDEILNVACSLVENAEGDFFAVRVQVSAGEGGRGLVYPETPTVFITASAVPDPSFLPPVRVKIERDIVLYSGDIMNRVKSNYAVRALARRRAVSEGFDDVVFRNERGMVTSAAVGNIIVRHGKTYTTPRLGDGVLDGITRENLLRSLKIAEVHLTEGNLLGCDAAWVVNSLGIRPIICIDTLEKRPEKLE
jgi:branched-chain amino acid aminotransferase